MDKSLEQMDYKGIFKYFSEISKYQEDREMKPKSVIFWLHLQSLLDWSILRMNP